MYLKGGAADAATAAYQSAKRADEVDDDRLSALYTAKAAQSLYAGGTNPMGSIGGQVDQAITDAKTDGQTNGGMSLRIGIGASSSNAESDYHQTTSHGSTVYSGNGDVTVVAREGDMNVIGSRIEGINTTVAAAGDLNLRSAQETTSLREHNSAKSAEVGFTFGSEAGIGVYVSASGAKGKGEGGSVTHAETIIGGNRGTTTFVSQSASKRVTHEIAMGSMFLAEHVQAWPQGAMAASLETRDPELLKKLRSQTVDWTRTYSVPDCSPSSS